MNLSDLTYREVGDYIKGTNSGLIIPVGTCEQHGAHLPLGNDTLVAEYMATELSQRTGMLIAPTVHYGVNLPCDRLLPGTATVTGDILRNTVLSITGWWRDQGFRFFFILTYHGDPFHVDALSRLGDDIAMLEMDDIDYADILERQSAIRHACEAETSVALYLYPERVRMNEIREHDIPFAGFREYLFHENMGQPEGYVGNLRSPIRILFYKFTCF